MSDRLPDGWIRTALGDWLLAIEAGASFRCEERPPHQGETGVAKVSAVTWGEYDESESKTVLSRERIDERLLIQPGDFLFSRANTIELVGACVIARQVTSRVMLSDKILRFRIAGLLPSWVLYFLRSRRGRTEIERLATGNQESMRNIGQERIKAIRIPVAPPAEQRRIVAALEEHLSELDAAVAGLERARANARRLRSALLETMFAEQDGTAATAFVWRSLGDVADIQGGIQKQPKRAPSSNHYPFLRVANVLRGRLRLDDVHRVELFGDELERLRLRRGDLLIVEGNGSPGEIGRMAVWDGSIEDCVHQNHIIRARAKPELLPEFLELYWNSPSGSRMVQRAASSTSGLHTLSVSKIAKIPVPVPAESHQQQLVRDTTLRLNTVDLTTKDINTQLARATRLRQSILKHAFEGKLVPQDPNDEPASVLLDRIRAERAGASAPERRTRARSKATPRSRRR